MKRNTRIVQICGVLGLALTLVLGAMSPISANHDDAGDEIDDMINNTDGIVGLYLKELNGPVVESLEESTIFEPASSIKALIGLHAMLEVQDGNVNLDTQIPYFIDYVQFMGNDTSCPADTSPSSDTLENGLRAMLEPSDNRWTQALRVYFVNEDINDTRDDVGMTNTEINHRIGCGGAAVANHNKLTLEDMGILHEAVANGLLNQANRAKYYDLMGNSKFFNSVISDEGAELGMSASNIQLFKDESQIAFKGGSYGLSDGKYLSLAGWMRLACYREYVWGTFIDQATDFNLSDVDGEGIGIFKISKELFRNVIHDVMEEWNETAPGKCLDIDPDTLNLRSKGRWITGYINTAGAFDPGDVDVSMVELNELITADRGDVQDSTLMVKFDRSDVEEMIGSPAEEVLMTVSGEVGGVPFQETDTIRAIDP